MSEHVDDETDEFEVIYQEEQRDDSKENVMATYKPIHDEVSTVCDEDDGLDRDEDSAVPSRCESLMSSLVPFGIENPLQYEKFLQVVKEENEKNRFVLEQIASMVAQLTKEKSDNTELRAKIQMYEAQINKMEDEHLKLSNKDDAVNEKIKSLTVKLNEAVAQNARKDAHIAELNTIISEKDLLLNEQEHQSVVASSLEPSNVEMLDKLKRENASQDAIIRLLTEELTESEKNLTKMRIDYRKKLDEISEQWERNYKAANQ